jgi:alpha-N-acetylglucosaminidase
MILLDLFSESIPQYSRFESFYGHYYIWNMLHDFGGNTFLFGSLVNVTNVNKLYFDLENIYHWFC